MCRMIILNIWDLWYNDAVNDSIFNYLKKLNIYRVIVKIIPTLSEEPIFDILFWDWKYCRSLLENIFISQLIFNLSSILSKLMMILLSWHVRKISYSQSLLLLLLLLILIWDTSLSHSSILSFHFSLFLAFLSLLFFLRWTSSQGSCRMSPGSCKE